MIAVPRSPSQNTRTHMSRLRAPKGHMNERKRPSETRGLVRIWAPKTTTASLANSEGWRVRGPSGIQLDDPPSLWAIPGPWTKNSAPYETKDRYRPGAQTLVVDTGHEDESTQAHGRGDPWLRR
jgi:hypothetical protein